MRKIAIIFSLFFINFSICAQERYLSIEQDSLNSTFIYNFKQIHNYFLENIETRNYTSESLIKARNQILAGTGLEIFAIGYALTISSNKNISLSDARYHYYSAGALSLIGFGFQLAGINNIGKAGIFLRGDQVLIRIKF